MKCIKVIKATMSVMIAAMLFSSTSANALSKGSDYIECVQKCREISDPELQKVCIEGCRYVVGFSLLESQGIMLSSNQGTGPLISKLLANY